MNTIKQNAVDRFFATNVKPKASLLTTSKSNRILRRKWIQQHVKEKAQQSMFETLFRAISPLFPYLTSIAISNTKCVLVCQAHHGLSFVMLWKFWKSIFHQNNKKIYFHFSFPPKIGQKDAIWTSIMILVVKTDHLT